MGNTQAAQKVRGRLPALEVDGPDRGELLVVGWGGTHGSITSAVEAAQRDGCSISSIHLRHLNPFPADLGELLGSFDRILVAELNTGQLSRLLRAEFLAPAESLARVNGQPFKVGDICQRIEEMMS